MARPLGSLLLVALLCASCSGDSDATTATGSSVSAVASAPSMPEATAPPPATTVPATTTTTTVATTTVATTTVATTIVATTTTDVSTTTTAPVSDIIPTIDENDAVLAIIRSSDDLTRFAALVDAVGADRVFLQERGVTILAPNDGAWAGFGDEAWQQLLADADAAALEVSNYLSIGSYSIADLVDRGTFSNALSESLPVVDGDPVTVGGVPVVRADLAADNGYVHVVGALLASSGT